MPNMTRDSTSTFQPLTGIYEPSAIQQLPDEPARHASVPGLPGFERAEGISPALNDGRQKVIIVSDDDSRIEDRFARHLLLDPGQLQIVSGQEI